MRAVFRDLVEIIKTLPEFIVLWLDETRDRVKEWTDRA